MNLILTHLDRGGFAAVIGADSQAHAAGLVGDLGYAVVRTEDVTQAPSAEQSSLVAQARDVVVIGNDQPLGVCDGDRDQRWWNG